MSKSQVTPPRFLLLDGRARFGDTENADVMDPAAYEAEAFESGRTVWKESDGIWEEVEYKSGELHHVRLRRDLPPAGRTK